MEIREELDKNLIEQLYDLYKTTWFTQNREIPDIETMLLNSYLTISFVQDEELIAFSRVISDGVYKAFIFDVIVHENYQNQGFGKQMMDTLINHRKLKDIKHIELYCLEETSGFYKSLGFENRSSLLLRYSR